MSEINIPEELESALREWIQDLQKVLHWQLKQSPASRNKSRLNFEIEQEIGRKTQTEHGLASTSRLLSIVNDIPEFSADVSRMNRGSTENNRSQRLRDVQYVIGKFGTEYFKEEDTAGFNENKFSELCRNLGEYLFSFSSVQWSALVEIQGLASEDSVTPLSLSANTTIRQYSATRKNASDVVDLGEPDLDAIIGIPWSDLALETTGSMADFGDGNFSRRKSSAVPIAVNAEIHAETVILALRLLHSKNVELGRVQVKMKNPLIQTYNNWQSSDRNRLYQLSKAAKNSYVLSAEDATALTEIWLFLSGESRSKINIDIALGRFEASFGRESKADKFIDLWIALESLFSPDSSSELSNRMCHNLARYIGQDAGEREEIYNTARTAYGDRSKIVHGRTDPGSIDIEEKNELVEEYLRRALLKAVHDQRAPDHKALLKAMFN